MTDDEDDGIRKQYEWQPGEREALDREMAERPRQEDRDATLEW